MQETFYGYSRFQEAAYKRELQHGTRNERFTFHWPSPAEM
jgi:hypothetical protein